MKIQELLNNITQIVSLAVPKNSAPVQQIEVMEKTFTQYAKGKLINTLKNLMAGNPDKELSAEDIQVIIALQRELFEVIKNTDLIPPHNPNGELTIISLALAQQLEDLIPQSRYQLLLPTVNVFKYEASSIELTDKDLELKNIVMSENNTSIIPVKETLSFAQEDGVFKYTNLGDEGKIEILSADEKSRVIFHSPQTEAYGAAIERKLNITAHGQSYGAVVQRLCNCLLKGGAKGGRGGVEMNSGEDANIGIKNFFDWYNALTEIERATLDAYRASDISSSLGDLIGRLARPEDAKYTEVKYCVEIIAGNIETILKQNMSLYDLYPQNVNAVKVIRMQQASEEVKIAAEALERAMAQHGYPIKVTYGANGIVTLFKNIAQLDDLHHYVDAKTIEEFYLYTESVIQDINPTMSGEHLNIIKLVAPNIVFSNWKQIEAILRLLPNDIDCIEAFKLLIKQVCSVISSKDVVSVVQAFMPEHYATIINFIMEKNQNIVTQDPDKLFALITVLKSAKVQNDANIACSLDLTDRHRELTKHYANSQSLFLPAFKLPNLARSAYAIPYDRARLQNIIVKSHLNADALEEANDCLDCIEKQILILDGCATYPAQNLDEMNAAIQNIRNSAEEIYTIIKKYRFTLAAAVKNLLIEWITPCADNLQLFTESQSTSRESLDFITKRLYAQQSLVARPQNMQPLFMDHLTKIKDLFKDLHETSPRCYISFSRPLDKNKEREYWVEVFSSVLYDHLSAAGISVVMEMRDLQPGSNWYQFAEQITYSNVLLLLTESMAQSKSSYSISGSQYLQSELSKIEDKLQSDPERVNQLLISGSKASSYPKILGNNTDKVHDARELSYTVLIEQLITKLYTSARGKIKPEQNIAYENLWHEFNEQHKVSEQISDDQDIEQELANKFHRQRVDSIRQDLIYLREKNANIANSGTKPRFRG